MANALVITSNPAADSLTDAIGAAFATGAESAGATARVIDLYESGFNPAYSLADREHYQGHGDMPADVLPYQKALADADTIAFVTPIYWYTMTAMMKGFFDRVICRGFAYDGATGAPLALSGKKVRFIMLTGGSEEWYRTSGIGDALDAQIAQNTFAKYCGITDMQMLYVDRTSDDDAAHRAEQLAMATQWGRDAAL